MGKGNNNNSNNHETTTNAKPKPKEIERRKVIVTKSKTNAISTIKIITNTVDKKTKLGKMENSHRERQRER